MDSFHLRWERDNVANSNLQLPENRLKTEPLKSPADVSLKSLFEPALPFLDQPLNTAGLMYESGNPFNFLRIIHVDQEQSESLTAEYANVNIPGRNIPVIAFSGIQNRSISLTLHFMATCFPLLQVQRRIAWLKSLEYPRDLVDRTIPPPKLVLALGAYLLVKGVLREVSATHKPPYGGINTPAGMLAMLPHYAVVDIRIDETENFFTGGLPDYESAKTEADLGVNLLGLPSFLTAAMSLTMNLY